MKQFQQENVISQRTQEGMTFLEVIFAILILLVLSVASASLIRNGVDLQIALSDQSRVSHRIAVVMKKVTSDLEHSYMIDRKRPEYFYTTRRMKTHFSVKTRGDSATLMLTTMNHRALVKDSPEGDQTFVVYKIEEDSDTGMKNLMRGETKFIPERFRENDVPMKILAENVKGFRIRPWNGTDFKDAWNSDRSEQRDTLPHMVEVEIEVYENDPLEGERFDDSIEQPTTISRTTVYIPRSWGSKEPKQRSSQPKYF